MEATALADLDTIVIVDSFQDGRSIQPPSKEVTRLPHEECCGLIPHHGHSGPARVAAV